MMARRSDAFASWRDPEDLIEALTRLALGDREATSDALQPLLEHDDANVREEALRVLGVQWKLQSAHPSAIRAFLSDPAHNVRELAAYAIAATASLKSLPGDVKILSEVLGDSGTNVDVRSAAYDALLIIDRRAAFPTMRRAFDPRLDIDWSWIADLRSRFSGPESPDEST